MKKVQKKLVAAGGARDDVAPAWFAPAMRDVLRPYLKEIGRRFDTCLTTEQFDERMESYPEKRIVPNLADQLAGKIKARNTEDKIFREHLNENEEKIQNHENRIQKLESKL